MSFTADLGHAVYLATITTFVVAADLSNVQSGTHYTIHSRRTWTQALAQDCDVLPGDSKAAQECHDMHAVFTLATKFGATVTDNDGNVFSWEEAQGEVMLGYEGSFPLNVSVIIPHVVVKNAASDGVVVQPTVGKCELIGAGEQLTLPLATVSATTFDATIPLGGAYWVRPAGANCSSPCNDCYWWWVDLDKPTGAFLAYVGYGAVLPGFLGMDPQTAKYQRPQNYGGISGVKLTAHTWNMGDIGNGLTDHLDWDGGAGLVTLSGGTKTINMSTAVGAHITDGSPAWGGVLKPYRTAVIEILGVPETVSKQENINTSRGSVRHGSTPLHSFGTIFLLSVGFLLTVWLVSARVVAAITRRRLTQGVRLSGVDENAADRGFIRAAGAD